ncbi:MAG: hypothetical protein ACTHUY_05135 [Flaviflexus sp.]|uniref:hypothetical protein n=1 Tax=Flaviflexus sp. TaxID=1969482 RepID=UPI003F920587
MTFRILEVTIAVAISIAFLWASSNRIQRLHHLRLADRCFDAMGDLIGVLTFLPPSKALARRRDLQFELVGEHRAILSLNKDHHSTAKAIWRDHLMIQKIGYEILDAATQKNEQNLSVAEIDKRATRIRAAHTHYTQFLNER